MIIECSALQEHLSHPSSAQGIPQKRNRKKVRRGEVWSVVGHCLSGYDVHCVLSSFGYLHKIYTRLGSSFNDGEK